MIETPDWDLHMLTADQPMFFRQLHQAGRTRRFVIASRETGGWDVREEADRSVVREVHYDDWHRVERARTAFALRVLTLVEEGWTEAGETLKYRTSGRA
jgi:hypothetical protein